MSMSNDLRKGRSCIFLMHVHLVFVTKYCRSIFTKQILDDLRIFFVSVCSDFEACLIEFEGEEDHVHLLIEYPPKIAISKLVNSLKGVSSRLIRKKDYPTVQNALWGGNLWSPSYFASSCGGAQLGYCTPIYRTAKISQDIKGAKIHPTPKETGFLFVTG